MYIKQDYVDSLSKSGFVHRKNIDCCTCGPLVYIRNLKCASTFFFSSFVNKRRWELIAWEDIDWAKQHVFSHIMDPVERRHKGVAEFINMNAVNDLFMNNTQFQNFIKYAPVFDEHTSSYHDTFGNLCYHIDWIPITGYTHDQVIKFTVRLLDYYGIKTTDQWDYSNVHRTHPEKSQVEQRLRELYNQDPQPPGWLQWYLENDLKLYQRINKKFDSTAEMWPEISWLKV